MIEKYFKHQRTEYYCGPAILQIVLAAFGIRKTQRELARLAKTDKEFGRASGKETGTSITNMLRVLRSFGLHVDAGNNMTIVQLERALAQHKIPIVCFTERQENWGHYSLVSGFKNGYIKLLDPAEPQGKGKPMTVAEFKTRWRDPLHTKTVQWAAFVSAPKSLQ
ncbi:MAG: C39 family peptidase [Candidatus Pacebacteria bacterium]|nr:C39 family peptidase [Candidatus Paceibacterota bacterium]